MRSITKREKYLIIILGLALVVFGYSRFFLMPVLDNIKTSQQNVDNYKIQVNELKNMAISNIRLRKNLEAVEVKYTEALKHLPAFEKDPEIAYNVKSMADQSQVKINSIVLSDSILYLEGAANQTVVNNTNPPENNSTEASNTMAPGGEKIYSVPVSINASGSSYTNVMDFVNLIETDPRIAVVNTLNIVKQQNISLTMNFVYLFTLDNTNEKLTYDFNNGIYGKPNPFN